MQNARTRAHAMLREYIESLLVAVAIALLIRFFVVSAYRIPTTSMWPTLQVGDFVFAFKLPYGVRLPFMENKMFISGKPQRGEVVVGFGFYAHRSFFVPGRFAKLWATSCATGTLFRAGGQPRFQ
jgi:signal peptidase I